MRYKVSYQVIINKKIVQTTRYEIFYDYSQVLNFMQELSYKLKQNDEVTIKIYSYDSWKQKFRVQSDYTFILRGLYA